MKTKAAFLTIVVLAAGSCVVAQNVEQDDMYFTSKDRAALNASHEAILSTQQARRVTESETSSTINPTDSYSARNVNPEYISGSKVGSNTSATAQYFTPNYQPTAVNQNLTSNCNCGYNSYNNRYGSSYGYSPYGNNGFGSPYGYSSMYNPMMGMGYGSYGMMSPLYGTSMYSSSLMFGFGSGYGYSGFGNPGMSYGFGSYYGMNSFYNPYASNYGYGYASHTIATVDNPRVVSSRNQEVDRYYSANGTRGRAETGSTGGRVATSGEQQYYNRTWRNDAQQMSRGTDTWNNTRSYQQNYNNSWNNSNSNNNWGSRSSDFGGGRSFNGGGGGGFSGSGAAGGGGGGGSRRGRD